MDIEQFKSQLVKLGGIDDAVLKLCTAADLQSVGLPVLVARQVEAVFKGDSTSSDGYVSDKSAARMRWEELLARYNPEEDNAISKKLKEVSSGQPFIVYVDGNVDVEASTTLLKELKKGFPPRKVYVKDGKPCHICKVGEVLNQLLDENPLYPGRALRPDGTCDQTNRSWAGTTLKVRQLIYLAVARGELKVTLDKAHDVLDIVVGSTDDPVVQKILARRYPQSVLDYETAAMSGKLPSLKLSQTKLAKAGDPFAIA